MAKTKKSSPATPNAWTDAAVIVAAALVAHGFCLGAPFYMDDPEHILKSPRMLPNNPSAGESPILPALVASSWDAEGDYFGKGQRSVTYLLWNIVCALAGFSSPAFHALNLLLHAVIALTVWIFAKEIERELEPESRRRSAFPLGAGLLFAVHPLASEATNYAAQSSIQLVTLFSVLATWGALRTIREPSGKWAAFTAAMIIIAALSKEPGLVHAGMNVGLVCLFLISRGTWRNPFTGSPTPLRIAVLLIILLALAVLLKPLFLAAWDSVQAPDFAPHLLTQSRVFWAYAWRVVLPVGLCSDHLVARSISLSDHGVWIASAGLAAVAVLIWQLQRRRFPVHSLLLTLSIAPLLVRFLYFNREPMVEYRVYPAMPWIAVLGSLLIASAFKNRERAGNFVTATIVIVLAFLSIKRSLVWQSEESIVENVTRRYPLHIRPHSYLQWQNYQEGRHDAVVARQERVQRNLNAILRFNRDAGKHHRQYDAGQALAGFMVCEQLVGYALIELGRPEEASARMTSVIDQMLPFFEDDNSRAFAVLYRARGKAKAALGDPAGARSDYEACLARKPDDTEVLQLMEEL